MGADKDIITLVQPDICVICDPSKIDSRGCLGAPDLVIEILSPANSEKGLKYKYDVYEEAGVKEYWLVLPGEQAVQIHHLVNGKFVPQRMLCRSDVAASTVLQGFTLQLDSVFQEMVE
jgi:Uma2 family endonuclease